MRLLIDNGTYPLLNLGDVAMLQAAVRRIRRRLPHAELAAVTFDPERLAFFCPGVTPVLAFGAATWKPGLGAAPKPAAAPPAWRAQADAARKWLRPWFRSGRRLSTLHLGLPRRQAENSFLAALQRADALVLSGGGYFQDVWADQHLQQLDSLDLAWRAGKRTLLLGHGCGPVRRPDLEAAGRRTLPHMDQIAVREGRFTPVLLRRWGVAPASIRVTGDDAVQMAYDARPDALGGMLGLNLRRSANADVAERLVGLLRSVLAPLAVELKTEFQPFPIYVGRDGSDLASVAQLFAPAAVPNPSPGDPLALEPEDVIRRLGGCRAVVTGSYHGGVFALAQGIPAVCLAKSRYYAQKFLGLAGEFGAGCQVVMLDEADLGVRLPAAVRAAWERAEEWRPSLLRAAERQIAAAGAAYDRAFADQWLRHAAA